MALKTKITAPGGFEAENGYRRVLGLNLDFTMSTVTILYGDYKDEQWRKDHPHGYVSTNGYQLEAQPKPADWAARQDGKNKPELIEVQAVLSGAEFLAQPVGTYLPEITSEMSLREVIGAICYGYAKTRNENAGAVDV